jgi:hypothetical protein
MKPSEASALLTVISRTDKRTFGEPEAISWATILTKANVGVKDAITAAEDHFGESREYLMPIHIIERVRVIRRERMTAAGPCPMPGDLTLPQEQAWRRAWIAAVTDGADDPQQIANEAVGIENRPLELVPMPDDVRRAIDGFAKAHSVPES